MLGYRGGGEMNLAIEKGEVHCRAGTVSAYVGREPTRTWIKTGFVRALVQSGATRQEKMAKWTMQYKREDGTKRFAKNSRKEGCFHVIGGIKALVKSPILVIAEGYATAVTLSQTLRFATVAAFDSGNLVSVAKALHEKYPEKRIVIAGDDDKHLELTHAINPGRSKAEEAARAVGGKVMLPIFAPNENSYPAGFEAVTPQKFRKGQLSDKQHEAVAKMKRYTDFNDLATKSALGSEGVERQVRPIVESLIERRPALGRQAQQRQRVQRQEIKPRRIAEIT